MKSLTALLTAAFYFFAAASAHAGFVLNSFSVAPSYDATISHAGTVNSTSNLTSYTFSSAAIGTAASDRYVTVVCSFDTNATSSFGTPTLDGVSMTTIETEEQSATFSYIGVFQLLHTTGTTATLVVPVSATSQNMTCSIYAAYLGVGSTVDTAKSTASTTDDCVVLDLAVDASGVAVSGVISGTNGITTTLTWSGSDTWTEDHEGSLDTGKSHYSVTNAVSSTTDDLTFAESATSSRACLGASFK